jgi:hypothetical protein
MRRLITIIFCLAAGMVQATPLPYLFPQRGPKGDDVATRFPPPVGARSVESAPGSFATWLWHLPLLPKDTPVLLFDGSRKPRQDVHAAVIDIDVGRRDLQQCADAVMRLFAEYQLASGHPEKIRFHPDPGKPRVIAYSGKALDRPRFAQYLVRLFADAGSASLQAEMKQVSARPPQGGDVLIQGGYPGHAVIVLAAAEKDGRRLLLLGQSYMPAQQIHVIKNLGDPTLSPWFDAAALTHPAGLVTPEWRPFYARDVYAFP